MPQPYLPGSGSSMRAFLDASTAVIEIGQDLQRLLQDPMRFAAFDVHHEADAARVMLERGVVQPLLLRPRGPQRPAPFSALGVHVHVPR